MIEMVVASAILFSVLAAFFVACAIIEEAICATFQYVRRKIQDRGRIYLPDDFGALEIRFSGEGLEFRREIRDWCDDNISARYGFNEADRWWDCAKRDRGALWFENTSDAALFKLMWGSPQQ